STREPFEKDLGWLRCSERPLHVCAFVRRVGHSRTLGVRHSLSQEARLEKGPHRQLRMYRCPRQYSTGINPDGHRRPPRLAKAALLERSGGLVLGVHRLRRVCPCHRLPWSLWLRLALRLGPAAQSPCSRHSLELCLCVDLAVAARAWEFPVLPFCQA